MPVFSDRSIRTVLRWQLMATATLAIVAMLAGGNRSVIAALLGGAITILSSMAAGVLLEYPRKLRSKAAGSPAGALMGALKAEAVRVGLIVVLLWLVFTTYKDLNALVFIGTVSVNIVISALGITVRNG